MDIKRSLTVSRKKAPAPQVLACALAAGVVLMSVLAAAQDAPSPEQKSNDGGGFLAAVSRWFKDQSASVNSSFESARKKVEGIGRDAGDAAKSTVEGAKDAAGAVARIPVARAVSGHEKCPPAPNGAPDCVAAASTMCKAKGFDSGKSLDMTTAEVCPPKVYMSGRSTGPECSTETFVSRAFCQ
ncbi:MAG TPA: hypothetical protein VHQ92_01320 [Pseudolabrys sp.]|jgi:hypothetical protein|nr:hypothetical protein [Pseudolabrys sp.]